MADAAFPRCSFDPRRLDAVGFNLHAVFDLATLPAAVLEPLAGHDPRYRQLILLGHGGRRLWEAVRASGIESANPIDDFTLRTVGEWAAEQLPGRVWEAVYPAHDSARPVGLQALGKLAGWHHDSPFMVGINAQWGSWFAYRAVLLAESDFTPTPRVDCGAPCPACAAKPCIVACPAGAMGDGRFDLKRCLDYRSSPESRCALACVARNTCPVAPEHRYPEAQIAHSYGRSLRLMARFADRR